MRYYGELGRLSLVNQSLPIKALDKVRVARVSILKAGVLKRMIVRLSFSTSQVGLSMASATLGYHGGQRLSAAPETLHKASQPGSPELEVWGDTEPASYLFFGG